MVLTGTNMEFKEEGLVQEDGEAGYHGIGACETKTRLRATGDEGM